VNSSSYTSGGSLLQVLQTLQQQQQQRKRKLEEVTAQPSGSILSSATQQQQQQQQRQQHMAQPTAVPDTGANIVGLQGPKAIAAGSGGDSTAAAGPLLGTAGALTGAVVKATPTSAQQALPLEQLSAELSLRPLIQAAPALQGQLQQPAAALEAPAAARAQGEPPIAALPKAVGDATPPATAVPPEDVIEQDNNSRQPVEVVAPGEPGGSLHQAAAALEARWHNSTGTTLARPPAGAAAGGKHSYRALGALNQQTGKGQLANGAGSRAPSGTLPAAAAAAAGGFICTAGQTSNGNWQKLVGSLESRLDVLLEDRRKRRQLEEDAAALRAQVKFLQAELAAERRRRIAAEEEMGRFMHKLQELEAGAADPEHVEAPKCLGQQLPPPPLDAAADGCSHGGSKHTEDAATAAAAGGASAVAGPETKHLQQPLLPEQQPLPMQVSEAAEAGPKADDAA
jgi:hypothetical protein